MTGVSLDLFTVILIMIITFICGYSEGHKFGRNEVRRSINDIIGGVNRIVEDQSKKMEEIRKRASENKNGSRSFLELMNQLSEDMKRIRTEQIAEKMTETKKEKDGDE